MEKPNYYAIIPADVRYNEDLTPNAKLLYGEITALTNKDGYCWASNKYFADLYGVSSKSISKWVSQLNENGYIKVEVEKNYKRKIYLGVGTKVPGGMNKSSRGVGTKVPYNNKENNKTNIKDFSDEKYISVKDTYKSKYDIAKQKGIKLKKTPRSKKQDEVIDVFKAISYYRDQAMLIHGMQFFKVNDESRNKAVKKLAIRASKECDIYKLFDWWLDGAGEWASYEPEPCLSTKTIEKFINKDKLDEDGKQKEVLQEVGHLKFYSNNEIKQAEKDGKIKWDWEKDRWKLNN